MTTQPANDIEAAVRRIMEASRKYHFSDVHYSPAFEAAIRAELSRVPAAPAETVPNNVWEALQRMIEDGLAKGPASQEDARCVARYRDRVIFMRPTPAEPAQQDASSYKPVWPEIWQLLMPCEADDAMIAAAHESSKWNINAGPLSDGKLRDIYQKMRYSWEERHPSCFPPANNELSRVPAAPAEAVTTEEIIQALHRHSLIPTAEAQNDMRRTLESFLASRAKGVKP